VIELRRLFPAAGDQASWRYVDFFTSNIRNPNTRRAYTRARGTFLTWYDERGLALGTALVQMTCPPILGLPLN
jgi:hypothetical protein